MKVQRAFAEVLVILFLDRYDVIIISRKQWPRGLRPGSAVPRLLGLWILNPAGGMDICLL
jgi:hypothetical protein